jgi:tetratricopeptide (TPR) repeat protein
MTLKISRIFVFSILLAAGGQFVISGNVLCSDGNAKEQSAADETAIKSTDSGGKSFLTEINELKKKNAELEKILKEVKNYNAQLENKCKELHLKNTDLELQLKNSTGLSKAVDNLNRERQILKDANQQLKDDLKKERAANSAEKAELYQDLGTAYTKAELFSLAIEAYNKALSANPGNAEVHYYLGLLYRHSKDNSAKAIYHLKKYLQFNPDASNKKDVEYIIKMLSQ